MWLGKLLKMVVQQYHEVFFKMGIIGIVQNSGVTSEIFMDVVFAVEPV